MENIAKCKVERETIESNGKEYFHYFIKGNVRGRDIKAGVIPPDSDIDGIHFVATARADKDNEALRPDMKFTLSNIRASVTGYYIKEL